MSFEYRSAHVPDPLAEMGRTIDLLAIFHFVLGGLMALFSCMFIIHIVIGTMMVRGTLQAAVSPGAPGAPPAEFGYIFIVMGAAAVILGWSLAAMLIVSGMFLKRRRNRTFCIVIAGIGCLFMPFGTVLGVFTLVNLTKDTARHLFEAGRAMPT